MRKEFLPAEETYRQEKTLLHFRLFDWHKENHGLIKALIHSLKLADNPRFFQKLARESFLRFLHNQLWPSQESCVFVPAPPRLGEKQDHAASLARALHKLQGGELVFALKRSKAQAQKQKNRLQRTKVRFLKEKELPDKHVIFVDDVLTTGSTARAAFRALQPKKRFLICSLAWKRREIN